MECLPACLLDARCHRRSWGAYVSILWDLQMESLRFRNIICPGSSRNAVCGFKPNWLRLQCLPSFGHSTLQLFEMRFCSLKAASPRNCIELQTWQRGRGCSEYSLGSRNTLDSQASRVNSSCVSSDSTANLWSLGVLTYKMGLTVHASYNGWGQSVKEHKQWLPPLPNLLSENGQGWAQLGQSTWRENFLH